MGLGSKEIMNAAENYSSTLEILLTFREHSGYPRPDSTLHQTLKLSDARHFNTGWPFPAKPATTSREGGVWPPSEKKGRNCRTYDNCGVCPHVPFSLLAFTTVARRYVISSKGTAERTYPSPVPSMREPKAPSRYPGRYPRMTARMVRI